MCKKGIAVLGALSITVGLTGSLVSAGTLNLDLSDFNDDVMRDMDDTMKNLDSHLALRDAQSVASDAESIRNGLEWAQEYFTKKGKLDDAIRWAAQGRELAAAVAKSAQAGDYDASLGKYDSLVKTCRACHDVYKPPDI
jgi:hypothetical protein